MKTIIFEGNEYYVLDETPTQYICEPVNTREGYHFISKALARIKPFEINTRVCVWDDEHDDECGTIVGTEYDGEADLYEIRLDNGEEIIITDDEFEVVKAKEAKA